MPISLSASQFLWSNGRGHNQKPLLYTLKNNTYGLGQNPHAIHSDTWWENAFDKQLKGLDIKNEKGKEGGISVTSTGVGLKQMVAFGEGRWMRFVPGGVLGGTSGEHDALVKEKIQEAVDKKIREEKEKDKAKRREERAALKAAAKGKEGKDKEAKRLRKEERARRREKRAEKKEKKRLKEEKKAKKEKKSKKEKR